MTCHSYHEIQTREELLDKAKDIFTQASYGISAEARRSASLDFIAHKASHRLLIKVHLNIDAFKQSHSLEINLLASIFSGTGLLIGERQNKDRKMEDHVVYERHGIPTVNLSTLNYILDHDAYLEVCAKRGGLYVQINSQKLKMAREKHQLSIQNLANFLNKSPRTIYLYEKGVISPSKEDAEKLKHLFNDCSFIEPIDILKYSPEKISTYIQNLLKTNYFQFPRNSLQEDVNEHLKNLGMKTFWLRSLPFDAMALVGDKKEATQMPVITGVSSEIGKRSIKERIIVTNNILSLLQSVGIWIHEENDDPSAILDIDGISLLSFEEFESIEALKELFKVLRQKKSKNKPKS
ncbi:MAG: helix-turn-helix domain-containing protein [Candidatus Hodarchaeota archaeon]